MGFVLAYHLIITAYGFWLPNDPRGSWSDTILAWELLKFGQATKTDETRSVANRSHDRTQQLAAKTALSHKPVMFDGHQALSIAKGFAKYVERSAAVVHACSIMPDHAHLVVARHRYPIEKVSALLKGDATHRLLADGLHPFGDERYRNGRVPTPWARGEWSVFLDSPTDIRRAIRYVEGNPLKDGLEKQNWKFVVAYGG